MEIFELVGIRSWFEVAASVAEPERGGGDSRLRHPRLVIARGASVRAEQVTRDRSSKAVRDGLTGGSSFIAQAKREERWLCRRKDR
jgi:hypothetical protein